MHVHVHLLDVFVRHCYQCQTARGTKPNALPHITAYHYSHAVVVTVSRGVQ